MLFPLQLLLFFCSYITLSSPSVSVLVCVCLQERLVLQGGGHLPPPAGFYLYLRTTTLLQCKHLVENICLYQNVHSHKTSE